MNIIITRFVATIVALAVLIGATIFIKDIFEIPEVEKNQIWITNDNRDTPYGLVIIDTISIIDECEEWALVKYYEDTLVMNKEQIFINYKLVK